MISTENHKSHFHTWSSQREEEKNVHFAHKLAHKLLTTICGEWVPVHVDYKDSPHQNTQKQY